MSYNRDVSCNIKPLRQYCTTIRKIDLAFPTQRFTSRHLLEVSRVHKRQYKYEGSKYFHVEDINVQFAHCHAYHYSAERTMISLKQTSRFTECFQRGLFVLPPPQYPPPLLCHLFTASNRTFISL